MMLILGPPYSESEFDNLSNKFKITDHLGGWDINLNNRYLQLLNQHAQDKKICFDIVYHQIIPNSAKYQYKNLKIQFSSEYQKTKNFDKFVEYTTHPELTFKNFVCSFNGSPHVSRKLLTSILKKFNFFNSAYCSKNFSFSTDNVSGHLGEYLKDNQLQLYEKFFLNDNAFCQTVYSFGHHRFDHHQNIYRLESKLTDSFLHIVSETMATSYWPFVTEKFLYSIVTRGLFLTYAQPGWHNHIQNHYGFKLYNKLFDYKFDSIQNPVERLVELVSMISKFSVLSSDDWKDLYLLEQDTIEYNYNWYRSKDYLQHLSQYE